MQVLHYHWFSRKRHPPSLWLHHINHKPIERQRTMARCLSKGLSYHTITYADDLMSDLWNYVAATTVCSVYEPDVTGHWRRVYQMFPGFIVSRARCSKALMFPNLENIGSQDCWTPGTSNTGNIEPWERWRTTAPMKQLTMAKLKIVDVESAWNRVVECFYSFLNHNFNQWFQSNKSQRDLNQTTLGPEMSCVNQFYRSFNLKTGLQVQYLVYSKNCKVICVKHHREVLIETVPFHE